MYTLGTVRTLNSEIPGTATVYASTTTPLYTYTRGFLFAFWRKTRYSPPPSPYPFLGTPLAWRASPPALGIAYCTRLPWAPPARWGFPALSGSLALNLGSLPTNGGPGAWKGGEFALKCRIAYHPYTRIFALQSSYLKTRDPTVHGKKHLSLHGPPRRRTGHNSTTQTLSLSLSGPGDTGF